MAIERTDPPYVEDELASYRSWLAYHRATLVLKASDLTDEQRRARPVPTSLMSLHGLVRHMAEVERNWFRKVLAGGDGVPLDRGIWWTDELEDGDFEIAEGDTYEADLAVWQAEVRRTDEIAGAHDLDDLGARRRRDQDVSLRWIYLHMIEEYARHNGHADLLRELVGGSIFE